MTIRRWCGLVVSVMLLVGGCGSENPRVGSAPTTTSASASPTDAGSVVLGIFPFLPAVQIDQIYGPLVRELSTTLGISVHLRTSSSFAGFSDALAAGQFDIALVQPFEYPDLVDHGYVPIARVDDPLVATVVAAADLVPTGPGLGGVVGLRIGTPPDSSAMRRLLDASLVEAGVNPSTLDIRPFRTHADCLGQLQLRTIDVCAVAPLPLATFEATTGAALQVIAITEEVSSVAFVARPDVEPELTQQVRAFLLGLDDDPATQFLLDTVGFSRYVVVGDDDYSRIRELISMATGE